MYLNFLSFRENYNNYRYDPPCDDYKTLVVIPKDLLIQIFSFLNPRDLAACSRVSKEFNLHANEMIVWKSLYQRFVPFDGLSNSDACTYKKAVKIIYLRFGHLQKKIAARSCKNLVAESIDEERANSCLFRDAVKYRIFFFAHALLEMFDAGTMSVSFCWDFSSKMYAGAVGALSFTLSNSPEQTKDVLATLNSLMKNSSLL